MFQSVQHSCTTDQEQEISVFLIPNKSMCMYHKII